MSIKKKEILIQKYKYYAGRKTNFYTENEVGKIFRAH